MGLRKPPKGGGVELPIVETPAGAEDIAAGKQAIDDSGKLVTGTHECEPGLDTSDATAGAGDMANGKTAYVDGEKVTGTLPEVASGTTETLTNAGPSHASGNIRMTGTISGDKIMRDGSKVMTSVGANFFGTATEEDVAYGKTFTSAAGLNVVGTLVKGKKVKTGYVKGPNSYSLTISGLDFKPVGIMVVPYETDNETTATHVGVIAGFYDGSVAYTVKAYSSQTYLTLSKRDASCTIGDNYITLKDNTDQWETNTKFFYVVWGE